MRIIRLEIQKQFNSLAKEYQQSRRPDNLADIWKLAERDVAAWFRRDNDKQSVPVPYDQHLTVSTLGQFCRRLDEPKTIGRPLGLLCKIAKDERADYFDSCDRQQKVLNPGTARAIEAREAAWDAVWNEGKGNETELAHVARQHSFLSDYSVPVDIEDCCDLPPADNKAEVKNADIAANRRQTKVLALESAIKKLDPDLQTVIRDQLAGMTVPEIMAKYNLANVEPLSKRGIEERLKRAKDQLKSIATLIAPPTRPTLKPATAGGLRRRIAANVALPTSSAMPQDAQQQEASSQATAL